MIRTEKGYQQTLELIEQFEQAIEDLKHTYLPDRPQWYEIFAAGPIDDLKKLKAEADEYHRRQRKAS